MYWAKALAEQDKDAELKEHFAPLAEKLAENEEQIVKELNDVQGVAKDIGGYYFADEQLAEKAMRPSELFNEVLALV